MSTRTPAPMVLTLLKDFMSVANHLGSQNNGLVQHDFSAANASKDGLEVSL